MLRFLNLIFFDAHAPSSQSYYPERTFTVLLDGKKYVYESTPGGVLTIRTFQIKGRHFGIARRSTEYATLEEAWDALKTGTILHQF